MKFSLIFGYKNREPERIQRCLASLSRQKNRDFEVIFVDYGSDEEFAQPVKKIVESFDFTYYFNDTRGRNWNRSHALNTGIARAKGEFVITTDVDIIYPPDFIDVCSEKADHNKIQHAKAFYLPESFDHYDVIETLIPSEIPNTKPGQDTALGLCQMVSAEKFKAINGFDEYFRIWGVEDLDVNKRLRSLGLEMQWIELDEIPLIHQWHPTSYIVDDIAKAPLDWFQVMWDYHENRKDAVNHVAEWGKIYTKEERPTYEFATKGQLDENKRFVFKEPVENCYNLFIGKFESLKPGDYIFIRETYDQEQFGKASTAGKLVDKVNSGLKKLGTSYRMTQYQNLIKRPVSFYNIRDFIHYFILNTETRMSDYYFQHDKKEMLGIFMKKQ